jgi:hypothetical protein
MVSASTLPGVKVPLQIGFTPPSWNPPARLYKFVPERQYAEDMAQGRIWISTLAYCRACEDQGRGDALDGRHTQHISIDSGDLSDPYIRDKAQRLGLPAMSGGYRFVNCSFSREVDAHVFCMTEKFDPKMLGPDFGAHCVEILNPMAFVQAVSACLFLKLFAGGRCPLVVFGKMLYVDDVDQYDRERIPARDGFWKDRSRFERQAEVRVLWDWGLPAGATKPFSLQVPQLRDLCRVIV